jgi:hypothetical protein
MSKDTFLIKEVYAPEPKTPLTSRYSTLIFRGYVLVASVLALFQNKFHISKVSEKMKTRIYISTIHIHVNLHLYAFLFLGCQKIDVCVNNSVTSLKRSVTDPHS